PSSCHAVPSACYRRAIPTGARVCLCPLWSQCSVTDIRKIERLSSRIATVPNRCSSSVRVRQAAPTGRPTVVDVSTTSPEWSARRDDGGGGHHGRGGEAGDDGKGAAT